MQKKLIALAIAGLVSTAAFAQSNVTIYGVVDASVDATDNGDTAAGVSGTRTGKISSNSSRIGFKGTEDLGDGVKAVFQIETGIDADGTGSDTGNSSRNTYVGLATDSWGQVLLGRYDTPYKTATRSWDLFADHLADNRNLMGVGLLGFDIRAANTMRYDSANFNGLKLAAAMIMGAESATLDSQDKGRAWSLSGSYDFTSAWTAVVAYQKNDFGATGTGTVAAPAATPAFLAAVGPIPIAANDSEKAWKLGLGYKEGPIRANFVYEKTDLDIASGSSDRKAWTLGGGYTFGANEIKLAYTKADEFDGASSTGAKQWAIGIDHLLSKRTKLYAEYVKLSNEDSAAYGLTGAGSTGSVAVARTGDLAGGAGADPSAFQFGVKHSF